jgi:hypothetical protein
MAGLGINAEDVAPRVVGRGKGAKVNDNGVVGHDGWPEIRRRAAGDFVVDEDDASIDRARSTVYHRGNVQLGTDDRDDAVDAGQEGLRIGPREGFLATVGAL